MKTILFPTDFSQNAEKAFLYAKMFAKDVGAEITVIHVYDVPLMGPANSFTSQEKTMKMTQDRMSEYSLKRCHELLERHEIKVTSKNCVVKEGGVEKQLVKYVQEENIDFVIMGTRGETDHNLFWIGSVAAEVMNKVKCPVLAIPGTCTYKSIERVAYTTDLSYFESHVLKEVSKLSEKWNAALILLHLNEENEDTSHLNEKLNKLKNDITYANVRSEIIDADDMVDGINDYVKDNNIDVLAMCTHTKSIFQKIFQKSLSTKMVFTTDVPILIFSAEVHPVDHN